MNLVRINLLLELVRREIRLRVLGTFSGGAWLLLQPLLQLAIYAYVFGTVFQARLPEAEFGGIGFATFLAIGLWPWVAFSESLLRATTSVVDNGSLLTRVPVPRPLFPMAAVISGVLLHFVGFVVVLAGLWAFGWLEPRWSLLQVPALFFLLGVFVLGMAFLFAALTVFVRDLAQALGQALTLLFFLTPVLYPRSMVPESLQALSDLNPMALFVALFRASVLGVGDVDAVHWFVAVLVAVASLVLGYLVFRRSSPHFEDFL